MSHIINIQGLSFTTFKEILKFLSRNIKFMNLVYFWRFCTLYTKDPEISRNTDVCLLVMYILVHNRTYYGKYRIGFNKSLLLSYLWTYLIIQPWFRYFLDNVERLGQNSYIPTTEDILHCRIKTSGIVEVKFFIKVRIRANTDISIGTRYYEKRDRI